MMNMDRFKVLLIQIAMILGYIGTIIVNALANILPINNVGTGEVSDSLPNLFGPAGLTFSIWGVIYVLLGVLTIYSVKSLFTTEEPPEFLSKMGIEFIVASVANMTWLFLWHYGFFFLSVLVMLVLLGALLSSYLRLQIGLRDADRNEKWFIHVPISVYLGWITIATVANVTVFLVDVNWNGFGLSDQVWTITMISIAAIITGLMIWIRKDYAYTAVVLWAFIGIIIKRAMETPVYSGIIATISVLIALLLGLMGVKIHLELRK